MVEELNLIKIQKKFQEIQNNICNFLVKVYKIIFFKF